MSSFYASSDGRRPARPATIAEVPLRREGDDTPPWVYSPAQKPGPKYETFVQPMPAAAEYHRALSLPRAYQDAALNVAKRKLNLAGGLKGPAEVYNPNRHSDGATSTRSRSLSPGYLNGSTINGSIASGYAQSNAGLGSTFVGSVTPSHTMASGNAGTHATSPPVMISNPFSPQPPPSAVLSNGGVSSAPLSNGMQTSLPGGFSSPVPMSQPLFSPAPSAAGSSNPFFGQQQAPPTTIGPMSSISQQQPVLVPSVYAPSAAPPGSVYPSQAPMALPGGASAANDGRPMAANARFGAGSRQNFQRFEQWTDHPYLHELQYNRQNRGLVCCCCD